MKTWTRTCVAVIVASIPWGCDVLPSGPETCGGVAGVACGSGRYCTFDTGSCGADEALGMCAEIPAACAEIFQPVCGCDGSTYGNACLAAASGVSVAADGACPEPTDAFCGGIAGVQCDDGAFCRFPAGSCGSGDQSGLCVEIPDVCIEVFLPVCGCDGETYSNECTASRAGVSVLTDGACEQ